MKNPIQKSLMLVGLALLLQGCVAYVPPRYGVVSGGYSAYPAYSYPYYGYSPGYYSPSIGFSVGPSYRYGGGWYGGGGHRGGWGHRHFGGGGGHHHFGGGRGGHHR